MPKLPYTQYVQNRVAAFGVGTPILVHDLGTDIAAEYGMDEKKANAAAAVAVKRIIEAGTIPELRCFSKGIYYLAKQTVFGETGIDKEMLIKIKYLKGDNGYETGATVMHKLGLISLMPAERTFVSNNTQNRAKRDEALGIIVKAPKTAVTKDNCKYLQFLDLLNIYDEVPVDADDPYAILGGFVQTNALDYGKLLNIADRHYNNNTIIRLAHVASHQGARI